MDLGVPESIPQISSGPSTDTVAGVRDVRPRAGVQGAVRPVLSRIVSNSGGVALIGKPRVEVHEFGNSCGALLGRA